MSTTTERDGRGHALITCTLAALILIPVTACGGGSSSPPASTTPSTSSAAPTATQTSPSARPTALPWFASVTRTESADGPSGDTVWVTTDASTGTPSFTEVDRLSGGATDLLGWYGAGGRTLVWQTGQDLKSLRATTFSKAGAIVRPAAPLTIPGVVTTYGYGFPQEDGRLVWVRMTRGTPAWQLVVLDADLRVVSTRTVALSAEGTPQFATVTSLGVRTSATSMSVWVDGQGISRVALPPECSEEVSGTPPIIQYTGDVTMRCGPVLVTLDSLMSGSSPVSAMPELPDGADVVGAWFDDHGVIQASSRTAGAIRTWRFAPSIERTWRPADAQGIVAGAPIGAALYVARSGADGIRWYAEAAPTVPLSPALPPASPESLVPAVRATM